MTRVGKTLSKSLLGLVILSLTSSTGCFGHKGASDDGVVFDDAAPSSSKSSKSKGGGKGEKGPAIMFGKVVDRNDRPLQRVTIRVSPGAVERISNKWGEYEVEYGFDEEGNRMSLKKGQDYTITAWKPGYHETTQIVRYEGNSQEIPTITLVEESITLSPDTVGLDPATTNANPPTESQGQSYEN